MLKLHIVWITYLLAKLSLAHASDSLSYSGRLVNADGSPVTGPVNLQFELSYTNAPANVVCTKTLPAVALTNGVFHVKLDYLAAECGGDSISKVLADTPVGESVAIKLTDTTHAKAYSLQALHSMPYAMMANISRQLMQMGATAGQVLAWDGTKWAPAAAGGGGGSGTVTNIATNSGLTGGPITTTGTIGIATNGVTSTHIDDGTITNADVNATAAIARTKLANGTASHVLVNDGSGVMSGVAQLPIAQGGTGAATAAAARTALGAMAVDAVDVCLPTQKLQMSVGPLYDWSCVDDELFDGGEVSAAIDMNSNKITELASPTVASDAANKAYVDAQISGVAVTQWSNVAGGHIKYAGGRVGVGVDPTEALDVAANAKVAGNVQIDGKLKLKSDNANFVELQAPAGVAATRTFVWPGVYGTNGQVLTTDGAGNLSWTTVSGGGGSNWTVTGAHVYRASGNVGIGTTTPAQNLQIVSADGDTGISISDTAANGIAEVTLGNDARTYSMAVSGSVNDIWGVYDNTAAAWRLAITPAGDVGIGVTAPGSKLDVKGELRLSGSASGYVGFVPAAAAGSQTYVLPNADGTSGQMLTTNGSGVLSWTTSAGGAVAVGGDLTGTVSNAQIAGDAIGAAEISNGAVGTTELANTSVTYAKTNFADGDIPSAKVNGLDTALATIAGKEPAITSGANTTYFRGDKTFQTLNTTVVAEGTNLYFLESRVRDALMAGYATGSALPIATGDTLLQALGKLEGSIASLSSSGHWTLGSGNVYRTTGNVGIGATSPWGRLHVQSPSGTANSVFMKRTNDADQNMLVFVPGTIAAGTPAWYTGLAGGGDSYRLDTYDGTTTTTRMIVQKTGEVGIGTANPGQKLTVSANSSQLPAVPQTDTVAQFGGANAGGTRVVIDAFGSNPNLTLRSAAGTAAAPSALSLGAPMGTLAWFGYGATGYSGLSRASITGYAAENWTDAAQGVHLAISTTSIGANSSNEKIRITADGSIGIGTADPKEKLHVQQGNILISKDNHYPQFKAASYSSAQNYHTGYFIFQRAGGTEATPSATLQNYTLGQIGFRGHDGTSALTSDAAWINAVAGSNFTASNAETYITFGTTNNGHGSASEKMRIAADGKVGIGTIAPASVLDITSTTSGILIPRMTTAERDAIGGTKTGMQVYNTTTNQLNYHNGTSWQALGTAGAGISSLTAGSGLTGGTITTSGTIAVDVGTGNNQIVQLNGSAQLPAVSGANLTNLNPANLSAAVPLTKGGTGLTAGGTANQVLGMNAAGTAAEYKTLSATTPLTLTHGVGTATLALGTVQTASGGTGVTSFTGTRIIGSNAAGTGLVSLSCSLGEVLSFNVSGDYVCTALPSFAAGFVNNGNSFAGTATLGTNDANDLAFETNNTTKMTIQSGGNVGIGTAIPASKLVVSNNSTTLPAGPVGTALHVISNDGGPNRVLVDSFGGNANLTLRRASSTAASPSSLVAGDGFGAVGGMGYGTTGYSSTHRAAMIFSAAENWTDTAQGSSIAFHNTPIGSTTMVERMRLDSAGNMGVGTATPIATVGKSLHLYTNLNDGTVASNANLRVESVSRNSVLQLASAATGASYLAFINSATDVTAAGILSEIANSNLVFRTNGTTEALRINSSGSVGIGTTAPTGVLHLKAGTATASTAPLKFTAGTNLTTPEDGAMEFDGTNLYITTGGTRKTLSTSGGSSNYVSSGTISTSNATASTSTLTGAVTVAGGMGIGGDVHVGSSTTSPIVYGSTAASANLTLDSTSSGTKGNILLAPIGGKVGVGTSSPAYSLHVDRPGNGDGITVGNFDAAVNAFVGPVYNGGTPYNTGNQVLGVWAWTGNPGISIARNNHYGYLMTVESSNLNIKRGYAGQDGAAFTIKNTGEVGVGTTNPTSQLQVVKNQAAWTQINSYNPNTGAGAAALVAANSDTVQTRITAFGSGAGGAGQLLTTSPALFLDASAAAGYISLRTGATPTAKMTVNDAGNVGIGTTSPGAKLDVYPSSGTDMKFLQVFQNKNDGGASDTIFIEDDRGFAGVNSGNVLKVLGWNTGDDTGNLLFLEATNGTSQPVLMAKLNGNVGINTAVPNRRLHVVGTSTGADQAVSKFQVAATGSFGYGGTIELLNTNTTANNVTGVMGYNSSGLPIAGIEFANVNHGGAGVRQGALSLFSVGTGDVGHRAYFTETGKFSIGTTAPTGKLHVAQGMASAGTYNSLVLQNISASDGVVQRIAGTNYNSNNLQTYIDFHQNSGTNWQSQIAFGTNNGGGMQEVMRMDAAGNVGIGSATPTARLQVHDPSIVSRSGLAVYSSPAAGYYSAMITHGHSSVGDRGTILFGHVSDTARQMVQLANGVVGIGTASPNAAYKLHVAGDIAGGTYTSNGTLVCTSSGCVSSSDERLKKDIRPIKNALDGITKLQGVKYSWIDQAKFGDQPQVGLIAQDLEKVYPEVVQNDPKTGYKLVNYSHLMGPVVEAIKELKTKWDGLFKQQVSQGRSIASLQTENEVLKSDVAALKAKAAAKDEEVAAMKAYLCSKDPKAQICKR